MSWIKLIISGGIGAAIATITVKILDILWLQKIIERREARNWVREQRLKAFSTLSKDLISLGLDKGVLNNPFKVFANASEAMLLIEDKKLISRIDRFIVDLDALWTKRIIDEKKRESEYYRLYKEARDLIDALRILLINS